jgi:hypothetical protein
MATDWGTCHLCGQRKVLTYEHIPAQAAYNSEPATMYGLEHWLARGANDEMSGGDLQERGAGANTLCTRCNSTVTGSRYVPELKKWAQAGASIVSSVFKDRDAPGNAIEFNLKDVYPALFLKQIVAMFASINTPTFMDSHPALREFALNLEAVSLPEQYRFYLAFTHPRSTIARFAGLSAKLTAGVWGATWVTDIVWPPFGYILTIDEPGPFLPIGDISDFAKFRHNQRVSLKCQLPVLEFKQPYPGEFLDPMNRIETESELPTSASVRLPLTIKLASGEERLGGELAHPLALAQWRGEQLRGTIREMLRLLGTRKDTPYTCRIDWEGTKVQLRVESEQGIATLTGEGIPANAVAEFIGHNEIPAQGTCGYSFVPPADAGGPKPPS